MNDSHATLPAVEYVFKKVQQDLFRGFNIHVMEVDGVSDAVISAPEAPEHSFLVSRPQENQFLTGFKFDRFIIVFKQFLQYLPVVFFFLQGPRRRLFRYRLYSAGPTQWGHISHRQAKCSVIRFFLF